MLTQGRSIAVALAKVGRHSAIRTGTLLSSCEVEDQQEETDNSLEASSDIYLWMGQAGSRQK